MGKSGRSATKKAAEPDNVFTNAAAAETWLRDRGIETSLPVEDHGDSGNLILRTIRYLEEAGDELSEAFVTAALLSERAAGVLDKILPLRLDAESVYDITVVHQDPKELGRLVKKDVDPGAILIVERPSVLVPRTISLAGLSTPPENLFRTLFDRLSIPAAESKVKDGKTTPGDSQVKEIRKLKNNKPASSCAEEGIMRSNGIAVELGDESFSALFPRIAKINHSCSPNAAIQWDADTLTMTVYAIRKIKAGEGVTIAYIDVLHPLTERQRKLQLLYGLACRCERCLLTGDPLKQSDEARAKIRQWVTDPNRLSFQGWLEQTASIDVDPKTYDEELMTLFQLFKPEGLVLRAPLMDITDMLVRMAIATGKKKKLKARVDAAKSVWALEPRPSAATRRCLEYDEWFTNPTEAPEWSTRTTTT